MVLFVAIGHATERGDYLLQVAGCIGCHTEESAGAVPLAGGRAITTPFGTLYSPNITFDASGIGGWTLAQFEAAVRHGQRADGSYYYPAFPYTSYRLMSDDDVGHLFAALQRATPSPQPNRRHALQFPFSARSLLSPWRTIHFAEPVSRLDPFSTDLVQRGRYLTEAVTHCGECHSPRDSIGGINHGRALAGATLPTGHHAPDLRPHRKALGAWTEDDIAEYLRSGRSDYTRKARDEMREFIECCSRHLTEDDRLAIARYLQQLPKPVPRPKRGPHSHSATIR